VLTRDTVVYAHWSGGGGTTYLLTFDLQGGTMTADPAISVTNGNAIGDLPTPAKDIDCRFDGWYTQASGGEKWTATTIYNLTSNFKLYARWSNCKPTVVEALMIIFDAQGGIVAATDSLTRKVTTGTAIGKLPEVTRTNGTGSYTFDGWYTDKTVGVKWTADTIYRKAGSTTLYARWSGGGGVTYTLGFDAQSGKMAGNPFKTVTNGSAIGDLPTPTHDNCEFEGWYTAETGGVKWTAATIYGLTDDSKLYARWINCKPVVGGALMIVFDPRGGLVKATDSLSRAVTVGVKIGTLPEVTRTGYKHDGWYTTPDTTNSANKGVKWTADTIYRKAGSTTLYARWTPDPSAEGAITVTFESNEGSVVYPQVVPPNGKINAEEATTKRNNYIFDGWYTDDKTFSFKWDFDKYPALPTVDKDKMNLYANWKWSDTAGTVRISTVVIGDTTRNYGKQDDFTKVIPYAMPCEGGNNATELKIALTLPEGLTFSITDKNDFTVTSIVDDAFTISWSTNEKAFIKDLVITVTAFNGQGSREYVIRVEKRFNFNDIVHSVLGGKMLIVVNNSANNRTNDRNDDGYSFKNAIWTVNGRVAQNGGFFYVDKSGGVINDDVTVALEDTSGTTLHTCPYDAPTVSGRAGVERASVYPNPVSGGGVIHLTEEFFADQELAARYATYTLYDVNNTRLGVGSTEKLREGLRMPNLPGVYLLVLKDASGSTITVKVAVQ
jgi:uncharacterized repeat protein (TIGR02543 family)